MGLEEERKSKEERIKEEVLVLQDNFNDRWANPDSLNEDEAISALIAAERYCLMSHPFDEHYLRVLDPWLEKISTNLLERVVVRTLTDLTHFQIPSKEEIAKAVKTEEFRAMIEARFNIDILIRACTRVASTRNDAAEIMTITDKAAENLIVFDGKLRELGLFRENLEAILNEKFLEKEISRWSINLPSVDPHAPKGIAEQVKADEEREEINVQMLAASGNLDNITFDRIFIHFMYFGRFVSTIKILSQTVQGRVTILGALLEITESLEIDQLKTKLGSKNIDPAVWKWLEEYGKQAMQELDKLADAADEKYKKGN